MKTDTLLLLSFAALVTLFSCRGSGGNAGNACLVEGKTDYKEYVKAYLVNPDGNVLLDSAEIDNGRFQFSVTDGLEHPRTLLVRLTDKDKSPLMQMDMPMVAEKGRVRLEVGEYILTTGTPLNRAMQTFLNSLQQCKDGVAVRDSLAVEEIRRVYSAFYRQQILSNRNNAVGDYIYQAYGVHLLPEDREAVENAW